jgi:MFS family permease
MLLLILLVSIKEINPTNQSMKGQGLTNSIIGIFGPLLAGWMCNLPGVGRKNTMIFGALVTMAFMFAYTAVRNEAQNLAFTCMCNFWLNVYYGTLYGYTPEVLPSAHRATGNGIAIGFNRIMGFVSAFVAVSENSGGCEKGWQGWGGGVSMQRGRY